jgi:hypothetical protein
MFTRDKERCFLKHKIRSYFFFFYFLVFSFWSFGGLLVGFFYVCFSVMDVKIGTFTVIVFLKIKQDNILWALTNVYGPILPSLKSLFWTELLDLFQLGLPNWVVGDDFNTIRTISEKFGVSLDLWNSYLFNDWISHFCLLDYKSSNNNNNKIGSRGI